jgi:uncharacterized damage-inducible protein DinB
MREPAMKKLVSFVLLPALSIVSVFAADPGVKRYTEHLQTSRDFTIKVAQQMPESDYGYKLTDQQMSFAEQLVHLAEINADFCAEISGEKSPVGKPGSMNKAEVIHLVGESYDYCIKVVSGASTEQLNNPYSARGGTMSGWELLMLVLDHSTHHRAQCEMYLRSKGITPTSYEF